MKRRFHVRSDANEYFSVIIGSNQPRTDSWSMSHRQHTIRDMVVHVNSTGLNRIRRAVLIRFLALAWAFDSNINQLGDGDNRDLGVKNDAKNDVNRGSLNVHGVHGALTQSSEKPRPALIWLMILIWSRVYGTEQVVTITYSEAMLISGASKQISCAIFYYFRFIIYWRLRSRLLFISKNWKLITADSYKVITLSVRVPVKRFKCGQSQNDKLTIK